MFCVFVCAKNVRIVGAALQKYNLHWARCRKQKSKDGDWGVNFSQHIKTVYIYAGMRAKNSKWARKPSKPKLNFFQMKKKCKRNIYGKPLFDCKNVKTLLYANVSHVSKPQGNQKLSRHPTKALPKSNPEFFCKILPRFAGMTLLYLCGKTLHCKIAIYCNTFALGKSRNKRWGMIVSARQWAPKRHHRKDVTLSQQTTKDVAENSQN